MEDQSIIKEQFWFNLTANDLKKIMEINKSKMKLSEIGGIKGLLMLLHTDQNNGQCTFCPCMHSTPTTALTSNQKHFEEF